MRQLVVCAAVLIASGSCKKQPSAPRLVSDQGLADLVNAAKRQLAENRAKRCERPVLRGAAVAGSWDDAIAKMATSTKAAITCNDVMGQVRKSVSATVFRCPTKKPDGPDPDPMTCHARPPSDPAWKTDQIVAVGNACRALVEQLQRAVAHDDACSPMLPGRADVEVASPVNTVVASIVHAGQRVAAGKWMDGIELLFDAIRWLQDLNRGGGRLAHAQIASALLADSVGFAHDLLTAGPYTSAQLDSLAEQLDRLQASENRFHDLLVGTALELADKRRWIEVLEGTGPGASDLMPARTKAFANRADAIAMEWTTLKTVSAELGAACPAEQPLDKCADGLVSLRRSWAEKRRALQQRFEGRLELGSLLKQKAAPDQIRSDVIDALRSGHQGSYRRRVQQFATRLADLAALRVHVELLRMVQRNKACPSADELSRATESIRAPARLGGSLGIEAAPKGFFVRLPSWLARQKRGASAGAVSQPGPKLVRFECPTA